MTLTVDRSHLKDHFVAGHDAEGNPLLMVETYGGLYAVFRKLAKGSETISAAPHKAVALWMAEMKLPGVSWDKESLQKRNLMKSEEPPTAEQLFKLAFCTAELPPSDNTDLIAIDVVRGQGTIMQRSDVVYLLSTGELPPNTVVRRVDLSDGGCYAAWAHPDLNPDRAMPNPNMESVDG